MEGQIPVIYGDGEQTRDFIFVKDVVRANILAMESNATGVYNIVGGREISVNELAKVLMDLFGMTGSPLYEKAREGDVYKSYAETSRAREAFGFEPGGLA